VFSLCVEPVFKGFYRKYLVGKKLKNILKDKMEEL
jgi:hypothetical protein